MPSRKADLVIQKRRPDVILLLEGRVILQHEAVRIFGKPAIKAHLLEGHVIENLSLQRALDGVADLLAPPGAGRVVAEGGVVIDRPDKGEFQRLAIDQPVIDAPAVAQAAIGRPDRMPADLVGDLVVVVEHVDRKGLLLATMADAEDLLLHADPVGGGPFKGLPRDRQELETADPVTVEQPVDEAPQCAKQDAARDHAHAGVGRDLDEHPGDRDDKGDPEEQDVRPHEIGQIHLP